MGGDCLEEVIGAAGVAWRGAELLVALGVTGGDQRVVDAGAGVLGELEQWPATVAVERVAGARHELGEDRSRVLHRHVLGRVGGVERPGVDHLAAGGVDDPQPLACGQRDRGASIAR